MVSVGGDICSIPDATRRGGGANGDTNHDDIADHLFPSRVHTAARAVNRRP
jgi:hypothetical protein